MGVFDLDKTIIDILSGVELANELNKMGKFSKYEEFIKNQDKLKCQERSIYEKGLMFLSDIFAESIEGVTRNEIMKAVKKLKKRANISQDFIDLYKWLKGKDFKLALVSSSPLECSWIIDEYPFDFYIAFEPCYEENVYTGSHKGAMTSTRKVQILKPLLSDFSFYFGVGNYRDIEVFQGFNLKFLINDDCEYDSSVIKIDSLNEIKTKIEKSYDK